MGLLLAGAGLAWAVARRRRMDAPPDRAAMLAAVVDHATDIIVIKDRDGRFLLVNPAAASLLGARHADLLGATDEDVLDPATVAAMREEDARVLATGQLQASEHRIPAGGDRIFSILKYPWRGPDGRIRGIIGVARDISELRAQEAATIRSHAMLQAEQDASLEGVLVVDEQQHIVAANKSFQEMWRIPPELMASHDDEIMLRYVTTQIRDPEAFLRKIRELYVERMATSQEELVLRDGRVFDRYTAPVFSAAGEYFGRVWFFRDISARKQLEHALQAQNKRLEELDRLKDLFLSSISHEMKTPLSLIIGNAELLEDKYPQDATVIGILDGSRRLTVHLNKILDYSALLSRSLPLYLTDVNLGELADLVHEDIVHLTEFQLKNLHFELAIAPDTPPLHADSRRLAQVMEELLENAVRFTPSGGTVGLRSGPEPGGRVRLEVWDTGMGIEASQLPRIWQAFTQLELGDAVSRGGLGLGLTIVKKLVELHHGTVEVASRPGVGSTFTIHLPADEPAA